MITTMRMRVSRSDAAPPSCFEPSGTMPWRMASVRRLGTAGAAWFLIVRMRDSG